MSTPTLSRVIFSLRGERAPRGSTEEYLRHQLVADLFDDREDRGYLYRTVRERTGGAEVLVLSAAPPRAMEAIPVHSWGCAVEVQSKPFAPELVPGQFLDFEVRLNATRAVKQPNGSRREDVWNAVFKADANDPRSPHDVYGEYLRRKLQGAAEVLDARVTERGEVRARRGDPRDPGHASNRRILFVAANVTGTLRVSDPALLLARVAEGVGRAKAFGCGLLCLSRPGTVLPRRFVEDSSS